MSASTGAARLLPATTLHVRPGVVRARTERLGIIPATSTEITRPFEIKQSVGGLRWTIRPFHISLD